MTWALLDPCANLAAARAEALGGPVQELQLRIEVAAHEATIEMVRQRHRFGRRELALVGDRQQARGLAAVDAVSALWLLFQTSFSRGRSAARAARDAGWPHSWTPGCPRP